MIGCFADWFNSRRWICAGCNRLIGEAGREGRVQKATGERWFAGHTIGLLPGKGIRQPCDRCPPLQRRPEPGLAGLMVC